MTFQELRLSKGFSQRKLAKQLGLTSAAVNQYESGKRTPDIFIVSDIAAALGVSIETVVLCFTKKGA